MGNVSFSVLEIGVANEPHVSNEIGTKIESKDGGERGCLSPQKEQVDHTNDSDNGGDHLGKHLLGEELVGENEVTGKSSGRASSGANQQINGPAQTEHQNDGVKSKGVFTNRVPELDELLSSRGVSLVGDVSFSFINMVGSGVVDVMTMLPVKVRDEVNGVEDESQDIIGPFVIRKRSVTAFVTQNPDSDRNSTIHNCVKHPGGNHTSSQGNELVGEETGEEGQGDGEANIDQESHFILLEQESRNCLFNIFDGELLFGLNRRTFKLRGLLIRGH